MLNDTNSAKEWKIELTEDKKNHYREPKRKQNTEKRLPQHENTEWTQIETSKEKDGKINPKTEGCSLSENQKLWTS